MLQLKNIIECVRFDMKSDFYIPIDIDFSDFKHSVYCPLCLTIKDSEKKIMEIGVGPKRGEIRSITLVSKPKCKFIKIQHRERKKIEKNGLPLFSTKPWNNPKKWEDFFIYDFRDFQLYLTSKNSLIIRFFDHKIKLVVVNERIEFCFDKKNKLCSIEIKNFNSNEMQELKENLSVNDIL